ncbi:hypothetical protein L210DRAFT_2473122 [Boletus edulis BED1]|uniref:Uncharacterized protein n=1 Tax=Boletus edulis BED1 TaxID=1328754 RepID=A0AAD4G5N7_BOLED|nr:hypothetical protein L210DRAFT_2473122 [Boletus edulis BED1]
MHANNRRSCRDGLEKSERHPRVEAPISSVLLPCRNGTKCLVHAHHPKALVEIAACRYPLIWPSGMTPLVILSPSAILFSRLPHKFSHLVTNLSPPTLVPPTSTLSLASLVDLSALSPMRLYSAICGDFVPKLTTFIVKNVVRYVRSGLGFLVDGLLFFVLVLLLCILTPIALLLCGIGLLVHLGVLV